jgi:hypothetical protein
MLEPDGDRLKLVAARGPMPDTPQQTDQAPVVLGSVPLAAGMVTSVAMSSSMSDGNAVRASLMDALGGVSFSSNAQSGIQFVVVPVTPSTQPPP